MQKLLLFLKDNVDTIVSGLVVVLTASLIIFIVKKLMKYFDSPRLEIYYDPAETYHKAHDLSFGRILGNFAHVMVKNKGRGVAKNCMGELVSIEELKNKTYQSVPGYRKIMQLKWAHEKDFSPQDIEKGRPRRLDVCFVHEGYDIVHFFTKKSPTGNQTDFPPGIYEVEIGVKSDNSESARNSFIVRYEAGKINSLRIEDI